MAIMHISTEMFNIESVRGWVYKAFDSVEIVQRFTDRLILRVQHEEVPTTDTWIRPIFHWWPELGTATVIDWGIGGDEPLNF